MGTYKPNSDKIYTRMASLRLLHRAKSIYRSKGLVSLINSTKNYISNMILRIYYRIKLSQSNKTTRLKCGSASANFHITTTSEVRWYKKDLHNDPALIDMVESLESDDILFDVGAHLGLFTCLAGDIMNSKNIYAFKLQPRTAERLRENISLNEQKAQVIEAGLSDTEGEVFVSKSAEAGSMGGLADINGTESADVITGDSFAEQESVQPNIVKIDVEGAETNVIRGLENTLRDESCRLVLCETHPQRLEEYESSPEEVRELLRGFGFKITAEDHEYYGGNNFNIKAEK